MQPQPQGLSAAAQPRIPAVSAAVSLTYGHAGDATGKLASGLPGALAPSSSCEGKKASRHRPHQATASLGRRLARPGCQQSWKPAAAAPCPQSHGKSTLPPQPRATHRQACPRPSSWAPPHRAKRALDRGRKGKRKGSVSLRTQKNLGNQPLQTPQLMQG